MTTEKYLPGFTPADLRYAVATFNADPCYLEDEPEVAEELASIIAEHGVIANRFANQATEADIEAYEAMALTLDMPAPFIPDVIYATNGCVFAF